MKVIGAGFGRTGTLSTKRALELLGFGPCYHMEEVMKHPSHARTWAAAVRGEEVDWRSFFQGWGAAVDWPACSYYQDLMKAYPDARVLLTVRDEERWYQSARETIFQASAGFPRAFVVPRLPVMGAIARTAIELVWRRTFGGRFLDRAHALQVYRDHVAEVKRVVPADRLLVFDVKQGWEPLCRFLGVPVPAEPFPHFNDTAEFKRRILAMTVVSWAALLLPVLALAGLLAALL